MKAGVESVRPVPDGDGQLSRVCVHADNIAGFILHMSASMLPFSAHFVTLLIAAVYWSRRSARLHSSIRGLSPQAGGFRRRSNRPSSVSRVSGLAHVPNERLPCVQQVLTIHLLFRIILQYTAVFQPRVPFPFQGNTQYNTNRPLNFTRIPWCVSFLILQIEIVHIGEAKATCLLRINSDKVAKS